MARQRSSSVILATGLVLGLVLLGGILARGLVQFRALERTVEVKGLSEREVMADLAIWPIAFQVARDELGAVYERLEVDGAAIVSFLREAGFEASEIALSSPSITDKVAQQYNSGPVGLRYTATRSVTVYTSKVDLVRSTADRLIELGRKGVVLTGGGWGDATEYVFSGLNEIKPSMIEEATREARAVATKFAQDSDSRLGKIRRANQGQFSIRDRDRTSPHVKIVRVVSTVEYYLVD